VPEGCFEKRIVDAPAFDAPAFGWIFVPCVTAADDPMLPWFFGEGTFVVNDDFIVAICISYRFVCEQRNALDRCPSENTRRELRLTRR
jgi:hypothetical protein